MNITQINFSIGRYFGGAPLVVSSLTRGLLEMGHKINLICNRFDDDYLQNNINVNITLLEEGVFKSLKGLKVSLNSLNTDIIHVHSYNSLNPFFVTFIKRNTPVVFTPHYHPTGNHPKIIRKFFDNTFGSYSLKNADKIIVLTLYERKMIEKIIDSKKINLIPNPFIIEKKNISNVDILKFKEKWNLKKRNILYVGRLAKHKGIDILIKAFKEVILKYEDTSLLIVGEDNGALSYLNTIKNELNLKQVYFTGKLSDNDLIKSYLSSDVFVLPSSYEAFGMVLLEAMAYGVPVIGTNVGGITHVLNNGKCGEIVDYGNVDELNNAIIKLLEDDRIRSNFVENGYKRINDFSITEISKKLEKTYLDLLNC